MKDNENKRVSFLVEEDEQKAGTDAPKNGAKNKAEKLKKPIIFALMGVVFFSCMYLIFKPSANKKKQQGIGLNDAVPQASDAGLQPDKPKAYEQAMMEQKEQDKRKALATLSDYWTQDSVTSEKDDLHHEEETKTKIPGVPQPNNTVLNSYRNAQDELRTFYHEDQSETRALQKQIEELKQQLSDKEADQPTGNINSQLALMEKSYEMASKYLPSGSSNPAPTGRADSVTMVKATEKQQLEAISLSTKNIVSALYREPTDSAFVSSLTDSRNRGFYTASGSANHAVQIRNSIRACVQETKTVTGESSVKLRLLESAKTKKQIIPEGTVLTANAKFQNGRLELKISSIEIDGNIMAVDITVCDLDGQPGLFVPYSPEMSAITEIASNMSQTSGTSIMMTRSAGQQMAGDLSRGVVQGISGYFTKKIRTPKVVIKAGHHVLLISK